jgi:signal transduction histidine kinase
MVRDAFQQQTSIPQAEVKLENGRQIEIALEIIQSAGEDEGRDSLGALLTLHDLESVQEIESELEISRRLSAIGRLTGGVGHEVKNPINAIVVHLELMRNKLRLDRVVETLIDFSRPMELKIEDEDLRQITSSVIMLASAEQSRQNVQLIAELPPRAVVIKADADMLRQAILNIVLNGTQAMPDGGTMRIQLLEETRWAVLRISDTGMGISQEILPRIFDLYFTTKKDGSGIGLAMCYRIVQLLSGVIEVESEPGHGTTFILRLPLSHSNERDTRPRVSLETLLSQEEA